MDENNAQIKIKVKKDYKEKKEAKNKYNNNQ